MKIFLNNNKYGLLILGFTPVIASAVTNILELIDLVDYILNAIMPIIMSLAIIYFIWSLSQYVLEAGEKKAEAREHMIWGIIIIFVMVSLWGLVAVLDETIFGSALSTGYLAYLK